MAIKILDSIEPAGKFSIVDAENVRFDEASDVKTKIEDLSNKLDNFEQAFTGTPTFEVSGIPNGAVDLGGSQTIYLLVESVNPSECRVQIKCQKLGTSSVQTTTVSCYPGLEYPITLKFPKELGTYHYEITVVSGTTPCDYKDAASGTSLSRICAFDVVCGGASLTLPSFTRENLSKIYSFGKEHTLNLDFRYVVSQAIGAYEINVFLQKNNENFSDYHSCYSYNNENTVAIKPGAPQVSNGIFTFSVSEMGSLDDKYSLYITAQAKDTTNTDLITSWADTEIPLDLMIDNSILQNTSNLNENLTTNDFLSFQFTPKTNNTNFNTSAIMYECALYDADDLETKLANLTLIAYNLRPTTVLFDKFSKLDPGLASMSENSLKKYKVNLKCIDTSITTRLESTLEISVKKVKDTSGEYVQDDDLVLDFDFSDQNILDDANKIVSKKQPSTDTIYSLRLINACAKDLSYRGEIDSSDKRLTGETAETQSSEIAKYFTFRSGQGAVLEDSEGNAIRPTKTFYSNNQDKGAPTGYSFEIFYKINFLGSATDVAASMACNKLQSNMANSGLTLPIGKANIYIGSAPASVSIRQNVWRHVVIVVEDGDDNKAQARIYINGILSGVSSWDTKSDTTLDKLSPLAINGIIDPTDADQLTNSGNTSVKFLRYYCKPLTDNEVFQNFKTVYSDPKYVEIIENRNSANNTVNVFFIRNAPDHRKQNSNKVTTKDMNFNKLNQITKKKPLNDKDTDPTSKTHAVNCTMLYSYYDENAGETVKITHPNVDVYLQGTSSLYYDVKNYQIKVYEENDPGTKKAILPPKVNTTDWPVSSYIYTLKCDYMEESHRNNTPTACFYQDQVLDKVIEYCQTTDYYTNVISKSDTTINCDDILFTDSTGVYSPYSPARRIMIDDQTSKYRDAIDGRPCILYYNDNNDNNIDISNVNITGLANTSTCVGSYMFNIDKEGPQLGFELDLDDVVGTTSSNLKVTNEGLLDSGGILEVGQLPCISYEGTTNNNVSAAAFIPYDIQRIYYLQTVWNAKTAAPSNNRKYFYLRKVTTAEDGSYQYELSTKDNLPIADGSYRISFAEFGTAEDLVQPTDITFVDGTDQYTKDCTNTFLAYISSAHHDGLTTLNNEFSRALHNCYTITEHEETFGKNEFDYISKTLEPRFTFVDNCTDAIESAGLDENELTYSIIKNAIKWVYDCFVKVESSDPVIKKEGKDRFRTEFTKYFSFEYCLAYFMQMMLFTQVDNAGKNAMFDTWGNGKLYPRPYDMDTQMGLDNSGTDRIPSTAELNQIFSPQSLNNNIRNSHQGETTSNTHERFLSYNTSNSALWKTFAVSFESEINQCYWYLRNQGIYDATNIQEYVNSKTRDVIGETFYNNDAKNKYLNNPEYFYCVNGSREDRYFEFLNQRIAFLDSYYSNTQKTEQIFLRAAPLEPGDYLVLKTLSPIYVEVTAEPDTTTCLITPEDTYETEDGTVKEGSKFTFVFTEANDKNMYIDGAPNLTAIEGLDRLNLTTLTLKNARNLTELDISGSAAITSLSLEGGDKLKTLNLSGCSKLNMQLDLRSCVNIESIDISSSAISGILLPENCNLTYLNCTNNKSITQLSLQHLPNLTNDSLILTGCTNLHTLSITDCPGIVSNDETHFIVDDSELQSGGTRQLPSLKRLTIQDCPEVTNLCLSRPLEELTLFFENSGLGLRKLNLQGCSGSAFSNLNLYYCGDLTDINLSYVASTSASTAEDTVRLPNRNDLDKLNLKESAFVTLFKDVRTDNTYDFSGINIKTLILRTDPSSSNPTAVKKIKNLNYKGDLQGFFQNCNALEMLENCTLTATSDNISFLFSACTKLETFSNCTFNFGGATNASYMCHYCKLLKDDSFSVLIDALPETVTNVSYFAYAAFSSVSDFEVTSSFPSTIKDASRAFAHSGIARVSSNLFTGCSALTSAKELFYYCQKLVSVDPSIFTDCTSLTSLHGCFGNCTKLTTNLITGRVENSEVSLFPSGNNIENISHLFANCTSMSIQPQEDPVNLSVFFANLPNLKWAIGTFYNCSIPTTFSEDYVFNQGIKNLKSTAALFAKSGLRKIPKRLTESSSLLGSFTCARGMFSNVVPTYSNINNDTTNPITVISSEFFTKCGNLAHIGASDTKPVYTASGGSYYYTYDGKHSCDTAGIFSNIPDLVVSTKVFNKLPNLVDISKAFFVGSGESTPRDAYGNRSLSVVNVYETDVDIKAPKFYNEGDAEIDSVESIDYTTINVDLFSVTDTTSSVLASAAYLFAGNNNLDHLSDNFISYIQNISDISGMLSNCINYSGDNNDNNNFIKLTQNKPMLTNVSYLYENCYKLMQPLTELDEATDQTKHIFSGSCASSNTTLNCRAMFKGANIIGNVPVTLFNDLRTKVADTSYMFAKCANLTRIDQGYATDFNIPFNYDNTKVEYYYNKHKNDLSNCATYDDFRANIAEYFKDHRDSWFGENKRFDRYRNYLEQLFFENRRKYPNPSELTLDYINSITDVKSATDIGEAAGLYYDINANVLKQKTGTTIEDVENTSWCCFVKYYNNVTTETYTSIAEDTEIDNLVSKLAQAGGEIILSKNKKTTIKSKAAFYSNNNIYTINQLGLLSNCSVLDSVEYMFAGCCGLNGCIPADMFASDIKNFKYNITSLKGLFAGCVNLTLHACPEITETNKGSGLFERASKIVPYNTTVGTSSQVSDTSEIELKTLSTGGMYSKIYPVVIYDYDEANSTWTEQILAQDLTQDDGKYFIPVDWAASLGDVTNIDEIFYNVGIAAEPIYDNGLGRLKNFSRIYPKKDGEFRSSEQDSENYLYSYLKLGFNTFSNLRVESANSAFRGINTLGGTELDYNFLNNSKNSLTDIRYIFSATPVLTVDRPFNNTNRLSKIDYCLYKMFYDYNGNYDSGLSQLSPALFESYDDSGFQKPLVRVPSSILTGSAAPMLWNKTTILSNYRNYPFCGLTKADGYENWFKGENGGVNAGYSVFNLNNI